MTRPYIIINCAATVDGKIAFPSKKQLRISSEEDFRRVQLLRERCDAVLVGIGTILSDDPKLTVKKPDARQPLRVVLDSKGRIPVDAEVMNEEAPTILFVGKNVKKRFNRKNVEIVNCNLDEKGFIDLDEVMNELVKRGVRNLLVEGGGTVIWSFINQRLFDELMVYTGPMVVGGKNTPTIADGEGAKDEKEIIRLKLEEVKTLGEGLLVRYVPIP